MGKEGKRGKKESGNEAQASLMEKKTFREEASNEMKGKRGLTKVSKLNGKKTGNPTK